MAEEQNLGNILRGRTIQSTQNQNGEMTIGFSDGSKMSIETGSGSSNSAATGGTIRSVEHSETSLHLEMVNGKSLVIPLANENKTVLVQDKDGSTEYDGQHVVGASAAETASA
jgi:outer membrane lipoprotein SlyB